MQYTVLGCDFLARCWSCTNQQNSMPAFFFSLIDMTDTTIRKNTKAATTLSEKRKRKKRRHWICLHMRFEYEVKKSDRNSKNWAGHRSNATCSNHYLFNVQESFLGHISWWVTNWAVQLISIVSLCLQDCLHQFSPSSETTIFGVVIHILSQKCRHKMVTLMSFLRYHDEIESDSQTVWTCIHYTHYYATL